MNYDHIGAGIVFLTQDYKTLFLQKRSKKWSFPGGHALPGETPLETAHRECKEETCHQCSEVIIGNLKFLKEEKYMYSFFTKINTPFLPTISDEHIDYKWQDIRTMPAEQMTNIFSRNWDKYIEFAILNLE